MAVFRTTLAKMMGSSREAIDLGIVEGAERLLSTLDVNVSQIAKKRLEREGVKLYLNSFIEKVTKNQIFTRDGKVLDYDLLIWTGGVAPNSLNLKSGLPTDKRGGLLVNEKLQVEGFPNISAAGDNTFYVNPATGKPAPWVAQVAEEEGKLAGENLINLLLNRPLKNYKLRHFGYVVPLKGKYAAAELKIFHFHGFLGWCLQQIVFLRYLLGILPLPEAFKRWNDVQMELMR